MSETISIRNINRLAVPAIISGIAEPLLSITDTAIIGNIDDYATESLAAVGIVGTFLSMLIWVFGQTRSAISTIISQHLGANMLNRVKTLPAQAIFIIVSMSILIIIGTYPISDSIFRLYNASGLILDYCVEYYQIRVFGLPFTLFTIGVFGAFRGLQNTFYPMVIAISGALLNVVLDFILVYGINGYVEPMYISGAAYASVIAQITMAVISAIYILKKTPIPLKLILPFNPKIKDFLLMVANLFVRTVALNVTLFFASSFATSYGKNYIAAYTIGINIWFFGAFLIDGFASAGNILSGKLYGKRDYRSMIKLSNRLIVYSISGGLLMTAIGFLFYKPLGSLFTDETAVLNEFYNVFWIILAMQPLCALAFLFDGIFKGLGKMKLLRNLLLISTFLVFLPILFLLDRLDYQLYAIFIALTFWIVARGLPLLLIFRRLFLPLAQKQ
ncbi:MAG: MATE family efflux transporter [Flavobacteriaceae bacterium]|nr:MATE family efflux transporter [Flavobacteriaceae bacterium]